MTEDVQRVGKTAVEEIGQAGQGTGLERFAVTGGILGAVAASSCCVLPLALAAFGVGGAWVSGLRALAPYQPVFIALALGAIGYGFYRAYWIDARSCTDSKACARPLSSRFLRSGLWLASLLLAVVVAFPYWLPVVEPYLP